jgi:hypothetical protein
MSGAENAKEMCKGCVYYPPNLPQSLYSDEDWELIQSKECSFDAEPGDGMCDSFRKGACKLVSLDKRES